MDTQRSSVAILGASGHIGKNLISHFKDDKKYQLVLFSRDEEKIQKTINVFFPNNSFVIAPNKNFNQLEYDAIINCGGVSDPHEISKNESIIFKTTEYYDNMILDYLENQPSAIYINLSSGAVYGEEFGSPVTDMGYTKTFINNPEPTSFYSIAKSYSEIKHRALKHFSIVDLRIFGFFSRFMDLNTGFFMSKLVSAIKNKKKFITNSLDFYRDFVHPQDLHSLIARCVSAKPPNDAFDVYSLAPASKFEILSSFNANIS